VDEDRGTWVNPIDHVAVAVNVNVIVDVVVQR
jgi:hypothetical protein